MKTIIIVLSLLLASMQGVYAQQGTKSDEQTKEELPDLSKQKWQRMPIRNDNSVIK